MISTLLAVLLCHAPPEPAPALKPNVLTLNAPATDAVMLVARNASLNVYAAPLSGLVKGEFALSPKDALVREVLDKVPGKVIRREDFVFIGKEPPSLGFPKVDLGNTARISYFWRREITAGELALVLSLTGKRPVTVAAPYDREVLTTVFNNVPVDKAVAGLAFFLGQSVAIGLDGAISIGEPNAAVSRDCAGFSLSEWTRLSGFAPSIYPLALLQTGSVCCPTETGRSIRTADGDVLRTIGQDGNAMVYRWVTGPKAGSYVRVGFDAYAEIRGCDDITRDSRLARVNDTRSFALLAQGMIECGVSRNSKAGDFEVIDIDGRGPYIRNNSEGAKSPVVQVAENGIVAANAPVQTR